MKRRFIVSDRESGQLVGEIALDDTGRIWWASVKRAILPRTAMQKIETNLAAGEASGIVCSFAWVEVDETAAIKKISPIN